MSATRSKRGRSRPQLHMQQPDPFDRKSRQLCEQVSEVLIMALGSCHDPLLRECVVEDVAPHLGTRRLRVSISAEEGASAHDILYALDKACPFLRREVAVNISRKRAPSLTFVLVPPGG